MKLNPFKAFDPDLNKDHKDLDRGAPGLHHPKLSRDFSACCSSFCASEYTNSPLGLYFMALVKSKTQSPQNTSQAVYWLFSSFALMSNRQMGSVTIEK